MQPTDRMFWSCLFLDFSCFEMFASLSANAFYLGILLIATLAVALAGGFVFKFLYDNFFANLFVSNVVHFSKKYFLLFGFGLLLTFPMVMDFQMPADVPRLIAVGYIAFALVFGYSALKDGRVVEFWKIARYQKALQAECTEHVVTFSFPFEYMPMRRMQFEIRQSSVRPDRYAISCINVPDLIGYGQPFFPWDVTMAYTGRSLDIRTMKAIYLLPFDAVSKSMVRDRETLAKLNPDDREAQIYRLLARTLSFVHFSGCCDTTPASMAKLDPQALEAINQVAERIF